MCCAVCGAAAVLVLQGCQQHTAPVGHLLLLGARAVRIALTRRRGGCTVRLALLLWRLRCSVGSGAVSGRGTLLWALTRIALPALLLLLLVVLLPVLLLLLLLLLHQLLRSAMPWVLVLLLLLRRTGDARLAVWLQPHLAAP